VAFLLLLLAGKLLATSLTIGIGGSGGVFAPSLSSAPCSAPPTAWPSTTCFPARRGPAGAYGLLGMGAVFAGAARAPITAVLIIFRTDRRVLNHPALMAAIVLTAGVSRLASHDTIYTLELARRGVDLTRSPATRHLEGLTVATPTQPAPS
jgi:CIC family chloride channel protein